MKCTLGIMALAASIVCTSPTTNAATFIYTTTLDGPSEPTDSPGTGSAMVTYDDVAHSMRVQASFTGIETVGHAPNPNPTSATTAAHIHAPTATPFTSTAGVATQTPSFSGFPLGVNSGSMDTTFDLTLAGSWNASFITANGGTPATAEAAFFGFMGSGRAYFNIHSNNHAGGEIRGFFRLVPEPTTLGLAGISLVGLGGLARRRRSYC
jgi:hypothetical protein